MAVVITFSGMVGSGKSVCAKYVGGNLMEQGLPVYYLRFRFLSLKSFFEKKTGFSKFVFKEKTIPERSLRFKNFRLRSNLRFLGAMLYYAWRGYLFSLLIKVRYSNDLVVVDRYIYDYLVQYRLEERRYRPLFRRFLKLLPRPDLAFVLLADFETVQRTRPFYAPEYIQLNLANYRRLREICPEIVFIEKNSVAEKIETAYARVEAFLNRPTSATGAEE